MLLPQRIFRRQGAPEKSKRSCSFTYCELILRSNEVFGKLSKEGVFTARSGVTAYASTPFLIQLLLSQTELLNDSSVSFDVNLLEVVEEVSSGTDHLEETTAAVIVLVVALEVLGEVSYSLGKDSDLNLGRTCVTLVSCVLFNNCLLFCCCHFRIHLSKIKYFCKIRTAKQPRG